MRGGMCGLQAGETRGAVSRPIQPQNLSDPALCVDEQSRTAVWFRLFVRITLIFPFGYEQSGAVVKRKSSLPFAPAQFESRIAHQSDFRLPNAFPAQRREVPKAAHFHPVQTLQRGRTEPRYSSRIRLGPKTAEARPLRQTRSQS